MLGRTTLLVSATAVLGALATGGLSAQEPDSTHLPRVVITATRVATPVASDALAVTVLDRTLLERTGVRDVAEALRLAPGVSLIRSGGPGAQTSLFLRGGESDYVRVLVDGVPVNDAGGAIDLSWLALDNVDRIEVVRGPASVLYGSDAVTGVVQIFTRDGGHTPGVSLGAEAGRYGARRAQASVGAASRLGTLSLGAMRDESDGVLPFNNGFRQDGLSARLRAITGSGGDVSLTARHSDDAFHYPTDGAGRVEDVNAFRTGRRSTVSADVSQFVGSRLRAAFTFSALDGDAHTDDRPDGPSDTLGFHTYLADATSRRRVADARLHLSVARDVVLTLGGEWMKESLSSADSSNFSTARSAFHAARVNRAAYAQWLGEHGPVSASLGARYDDNDTFGAFRTARVALGVRTWRGAVVRGSMGHAFKAPTFLETFDAEFSVGNPDLVPERSRSWELGLRQEFTDGRVSLAATYFDQRFRDMIQYAFQSPGQPNYFNVAAAHARGVELELAAVLGSRARASVASTLLRTRVDDAGLESGDGATFVAGQRLIRRPPHLTTLTLGMNPASRTTLDIVARHVGPRDDRDFASFPATPVQLPAYTRVDLSAIHSLAHDTDPMRIDLRVRIENVLGSGYQDVLGFPAPGRALTLGLTLTTRR